MNDTVRYWTRRVGSINVGRYHLEKVGHSLLVGAGLAATGIYPGLAVALAVIGYLLIGKLLVDSRPSLDWIADLVIGGFAVPVVLIYRGHLSEGLAVAGVLWVLYCVLILWRRWGSP